MLILRATSLCHYTIALKIANCVTAAQKTSGGRQIIRIDTLILIKSLIMLSRSSLSLVVFAVALSAQVAEIGHWDPKESNGISLVQGPDASWRIENGFAVITPVHDYYHRACFLIRVDKPVRGPVWLTLSYLDRGYGLISLHFGPVGAHPIPPRREWGITRLNTGKVRRAVFQFDHPEFSHELDSRLKPGADFRVVGIQSLASISLSSAQPVIDSVPDVPPAITFRVPGERVVTAGADAHTLEGLPDALAMMRELLPLARALGFNGIESYVKWNFVERSPGVFDWSFYDAITNEIEKHGLRWFPLIVVGSAYTLPDWFFNSGELVGYQCLEHHIANEIPTIFCDNQVKYVRRFLAEFGKHYASRKVLLGLRLGPSANYGEAQYPATGLWGYRDRPLHSHIGYWAADPYASISFRNAMKLKYGAIADLNKAWDDHFQSFENVHTFLPITALTDRKRLDFSTWYMDSMSQWCEKWATWARQAMPNTSIYQSSGGWGAVEIGTDYSYQARSMAKLHGGIRLTNEGDDFLHNFTSTRMASSAARFYGAKLGYEPASFGSLRGVMARIFNTMTNGADHLFYYHTNLYGNDQGIDAWIRFAPLLDRRSKPMIDIAAFYPDTANKLSDEVLRYLHASAYFPRAQALRQVTDYDFVSEQMINDGALDRYKVLVFLWGRVTEKPVLERIDRWLRAGGTIIYPTRQQAREGLIATVEGDHSISQRWQNGDTGQGHVIFYEGPPDPLPAYFHFVRDELRQMPQLSPPVRRALRTEAPPGVFWSVLSHGEIVFLNFNDENVQARLEGGKTLQLQPFTIAVD